METYKRKLKLSPLLADKSFFLLGPRSTGKTFLIKNTAEFKENLVDLLRGGLLARLQETPELLEKIIDENQSQICIIDEIQKYPALLDEVHRLIEERQFRFILTGSSARKLKRSHANMLGGRAGMIHFFPLVYPEFSQFSLEKYLLIGGLPKIQSAKKPFDGLEDYISTYLEQEIQLEANIRNLGPFQRFLKTAAFYSGEMIQYTNISNDSGVPISTVRDYFQLLEDTLVGFILEPWTESKKRKAIQTSKFYLFDTGIQNALLNVQSLDRASDRWGKLFESFILNELRAFNSYFQKRRKIYYWRSTNKQEVDFIIGSDLAIEVKSTAKVSNKHLLGLKALQEEGLIKKYFIISNDRINRVEDGIHIIYWEKFLKKLWAGELL